MTTDTRTPLTARHRRTLAVITSTVVLLATGVAVYQHVAPTMRLKADGYTKAGTVQGHDVWAKIDGDRISMHLIGDHGDLCPGGGPYSPAIPLCADAFDDGGSAFVAVVPPSSAATIVTTDGTELPATVVQEPGWPYGLAVRVAQDHSLLGARMK